MDARIKTMLWGVFVVVRYIVAVVVSFFVSMAIAISLPDFLPAWTSNDSHFWDFMWLFSVGFVGVAAGSLCLPRSHQWFGSLILLFLGLGFTLFVCCGFSGDDSGALFPLVPIGCGGILPVVIHFLLRPKSESMSVPLEPLVNPQ